MHCWKKKCDQGTFTKFIIVGYDCNTCVQILASHGANLVTESPTGYTAMHCAAMYGNLECLEVHHSTCMTRLYVHAIVHTCTGVAIYEM